VTRVQPADCDLRLVEPLRVGNVSHSIRASIARDSVDGVRSSAEILRRCPREHDGGLVDKVEVRFCGALGGFVHALDFESESAR